MEKEIGRRLLPNAIDEIAQSSPQKLLAVVPRSANPKDGLQDITYSLFAGAIDRCAWWLEKVLGKSEKFETITYIGPVNLLYPILMFAACKTGYKALLTAPGNTIEALISLYEETQCGVFLRPDAEPRITRHILSRRSMLVKKIPDLDFFLQPDAVVPYPYGKSYIEARYNPLVVLHTSGSTGLPRAITVPQAQYSCFDAFSLLSGLEHKSTFFDVARDTRMLMGLPLFHAAGLNYFLGLAIFYGVTCVLPAPTGPLTAQAVDSLLDEAKVQGAVLPPSVLVDLFKLTSNHENIKRLKFIAYGGGFLPKEFGDQICKMTRLITLIGSTECGIYPVIPSDDPDDWAYVRFTQAVGHDMRPHGIEGIYEHCFAKRSKQELFQSIFYTFPELEEYATKELYKKHPTKADLWLICGRADDVVVLSNGEKFNPVDFESRIEAQPAVRSAIVGGQGKPQATLLVEPIDANTAEDQETLMKEIRPTIEDANKILPSHGIILKDFTILSNPEKPFLRSGKGTVQRQSTLELYEPEINERYQDSTSGDSSGQAPDSEVPSNASLEDCIRHFMSKHSLPEDSLTREADLFEHGLDSIKVVALCKEMNAFISRSELEYKPMTPQMIYDKPSIEKLTRHPEEQANGSIARDERNRVLEDLLARYTTLPESLDSAKSESKVVLLTGSTGSLGSHLLAGLLRTSSVKHIYCVNRSKGACKRYGDFKEAQNLSLDPKKVTFVTGNFSESRLGVDHTSYDSMSRSVTHLIHNAWEVNFNRSVESFGPTHLNGVRELITFCVTARSQPTLFFVSSESTVTNLGPGDEAIVKERTCSNWDTAQDIGYAQSKLIAERMITAASERSRLKSIICRVGQIAGPSNDHGTSDSGSWDSREWVPSLIIGSMDLGKIPTSLGPRDLVDWVPIDLTARVVLELLLEEPDLVDSQPSPAVYHIVNPRRKTWSNLIPTITAFSPVPLRTVPFADWFRALQTSESCNNNSDACSNPALPLINFFEQLHGAFELPAAVLDTQNAVKKSKTLAEMKPVDETWMGLWMKQWGYSKRDGNVP